MYICHSSLKALRNFARMHFIVKSIICISFCLTGWTSLQGQQYLQALAKRGDGAISLLREFQCYTTCNLSEFYRLNPQSRRRGLRENGLYRLPILVYNYNGRSIRSTINLNDLPRAKRIQAYNESVHQSRLKEQDYRQANKQLWVPYHFLSCPHEEAQDHIAALEITKPEPVSTPKPKPKAIGIRGNYPILGPKESRVPLIDNRLRGFVFYMVSGHGGPDPGATTRRAGKTLAEDEYAYDIGLRLTRNLLSHGATVYVIVRDPNDGIRSGQYLPPDKDEVVWGNVPIPRSQVLRLQQRVDIVNALHQKNQTNGVLKQRQIIMHIDSRNVGKRIDMFFYHKKGDMLGLNLAKTIRKTLEAKYAQVQKGRIYKGDVSTRDLFVLRETQVPSVFIELGNIKNPQDQGRWVLERNRELVASWLTEGIIAAEGR